MRELPSETTVLNRDLDNLNIFVAGMSKKIGMLLYYVKNTANSSDWGYATSLMLRMKE